MATGDLRNQIQKLRSELRKVQYSAPLDTTALAEGAVESILPIIHHGLLEFSPAFLSLLVAKKYSLREKNDRRFLEVVYRVAREELGLRCNLSLDQFFSPGYAERKIMFLIDLLRAVQTKHEEILKSEAPPKSIIIDSVAQAKSAKHSVLVSKHPSQSNSEAQRQAQIISTSTSGSEKVESSREKYGLSKGVSWWLGPSQPSSNHSQYHLSAPQSRQMTQKTGSFASDVMADTSPNNVSTSHPQRDTVGYEEDDFDELDGLKHQNIFYDSQNHHSYSHPSNTNSTHKSMSDFTGHEEIIERPHPQPEYKEEESMMPMPNPTKLPTQTKYAPISTNGDSHGCTKYSQHVYTRQHEHVDVGEKVEDYNFEEPVRAQFLENSRMQSQRLSDLDQNQAVVQLAEAISLLGDRLSAIEGRIQRSLEKMDGRMSVVESRLSFLESITSPAEDTSNHQAFNKIPTSGSSNGRLMP